MWRESVSFRGSVTPRRNGRLSSSSAQTSATTTPALAIALPVLSASSSSTTTTTEDGIQLRMQLEQLLNMLPTFAERAVQQVLPQIETSELKQLNSGRTGAATGGGTSASGDGGDGSLLSPGMMMFKENGDMRSFNELSDIARRIGLHAVDALTPWDFDRHDFGVTFSHTWKEREILPRVLARVGGSGDGGGNGQQSREQRERKKKKTAKKRKQGQLQQTRRRTDDETTEVKVTSTVKPLEGEWKVTARSKLWESADGNGVVFGKAGMFLAGKRTPPPYIGIEADHVWALPERFVRKLTTSESRPRSGAGDGILAGILRRSMLFGNINYRSSRSPRKDPVKWSFGIQHDFEIGKGFDITLRIGLHPGEKRMFFVTPVPNGTYY